MPAMTDPASTDLGGLTEALGSPPPDSLATLDQGVVDDLAAMVTDARLHQQQEMARAIDDALRIIPRPLRGIVRKVIVP